jgi:hypothetical protein
MIKLLSKRPFAKTTTTVRIYKRACMALLQDSTLSEGEFAIVQRFVEQCLDATQDSVDSELIVALSALCDDYPIETVRWGVSAKRQRFTFRAVLAEQQKKGRSLQATWNDEEAADETVEADLATTTE